MRSTASFSLCVIYVLSFCCHLFFPLPSNLPLLTQQPHPSSLKRPDNTADENKKKPEERLFNWGNLSERPCKNNRDHLYRQIIQRTFYLIPTFSGDMHVYLGGFTARMLLSSLAKSGITCRFSECSMK